MDDLKRCPFCGGEASLLLNTKRKIYGKDEYKTGVVACCNVCEARMFYVSEKLAIEAWNRRVSEHYTDQWIPVSERLPKTYERVLTTAKGHGSRVRENFLINAARGEWSYDAYSVLAWMPLPEPYREETEDAEQLPNDC